MGGGNLAPRARGECIPAAERARIRERVRADQAARHARAEGRSEVLAPYPLFPQGGNLLEDILLAQFVDLDPGAGRLLDWNCTDWTYDGHTGIDSDIRSFAEQEVGVPVFAALDGVVTDVHDGEPDRSTSWSGARANFVVLYHGGTLYTLYYHLKRGSVCVAPGRQVRAGAQIGLTGSSGSSSWPHLHFESLSGSPTAPFDPNVGACSPGGNGWARPIAVARETVVTDAGLTDVPLSTLPGLPTEIPRRGTFVEGARDVGVWVNLAGLPASASWRLRYLRPDGTARLDTGPGAFGNKEAWRRCWFWWQYRVALDQRGTWHLQIDVNDAAIVRAPFTVVPAGTPAANQPPHAITAALDPARPTARDVVLCRVTGPSLYGDADYDVVRYHYVWTAGGRVLRDVTTAARSDALPWGLARGGEVLRCRVTPSDGTADGPGGTAEATVADLPNRPPAAPELLAPGDGATVSDRPTLRALVADPDGEPCQLVVELSQGAFVRRFTTPAAQDGAEAAFTPPEGQALAPGAWVWRARGVDARGLVGDWSGTRTLQVSRPPGVPDLRSPLDGAVTSPTPLLRLISDVPGGGTARLALEVIQGTRVRVYDGGEVSSGVEAAFPLPAGEPLGPGTWRWRARLVAADGTAGAWSYSPSFRVPSPPPGITLRPGLDTLGLPALSQGSAAGTMGIVEARVTVWDAAAQGYVALNALSAVLPGVGYWAGAASPMPLRFAGQPAASAFTVELQPGWNLVSAPFPDPLTWDTRALRVRRLGDERTLADAAAAGWLDPCAWQWDAGAAPTGQHVLVTDAGTLPGSSSRIPPWRAFWIRAAGACALLLPPPAQMRGRTPTIARSARGWSSPIRATGPRGTATVVVGTTEGAAISLVPPPDPPGWDAGTRMTVSTPAGPATAVIGSVAAPRQEWELTVSPTADAGPESITLTWPNLAALPAGTALTLVDTATGVRRSLRATPAYTFTAAEPRRFVLVAEPRAAGALLIAGLRLDGRCGRSGRTVRFTLSTDASVDIEVLSPSGRMVGAVTRARLSLAGANQVAWAGNVAPGLYLLRAVATTDAGSRVQAVMPVAVVR